MPVNVGPVTTPPRFPHMPDEARKYLFDNKLPGRDAPRFVLNPDEQDALRVRNLEAQKAHQDAVMAEIRGSAEDVLQMSFPSSLSSSRVSLGAPVEASFPDIHRWFQ